MVNKCLVTKLKAVVDNQNLPIFEEMQQFTLDAITASGNSSMTDDQKWTLNHFFYAVGAINNPTLWAKVKYLAIPMICNDNDAKALRDYKNNSEIGSFKGGTWSNHGVMKAGVTVLSTAFTGSNNDATVIFAIMGEGFVNNTNTQFVIDKNTSDRHFLYVAKSSNQNVYYGGDSIADWGKSFSNPCDIGSFTSAADRINISVISSAVNYKVTREATAEELARRNATVNYENNYLRFNSSSDYYGLMLISSAMTDAERDAVMEAVKGLKLAFSTSNS